jgi:hypothetical protein
MLQHASSSDASGSRFGAGGNLFPIRSWCDAIWNKF